MTKGRIITKSNLVTLTPSNIALWYTKLGLVCRKPTVSQSVVVMVVVAAGAAAAAVAVAVAVGGVDVGVVIKFIV
uniref:Uncharacterized protein n=1 Tax=Glossina palpalis gambiensis TaxID=67801 RepID=A0A1B0BZR2_9MUSC